MTRKGSLTVEEKPILLNASETGHSSREIAVSLECSHVKVA